MVSTAVYWEYKRLRARQMATYSKAGDAAYGYHAVVAYNAAMRYVYPRKDLVAANKRCAKRG